MPNPLKVPELMSEYVKWLQSDREDHEVKIAADAHFKLVSIYPLLMETVVAHVCS